MKKYSQSLKVRSYELDILGHVNNATYLNYLEYCRVATLEDVGLPFEKYVEQGIFIVIAEINIKYLVPAFLGDELEITLETIKVGRSSFTFKQEIYNKANSKKIVDAQLIAVFIDKTGKPIPVDEKFKKAFM